MKEKLLREMIRKQIKSSLSEAAPKAAVGNITLRGFCLIKEPVLKPPASPGLTGNGPLGPTTGIFVPALGINKFFALPKKPKFCDIGA